MGICRLPLTHGVMERREFATRVPTTNVFDFNRINRLTNRVFLLYVYIIYIIILCARRVLPDRVKVFKLFIGYRGAGLAEFVFDQYSMYGYMRTRVVNFL
jgi:hypothetical protein